MYSAGTSSAGSSNQRGVEICVEGTMFRIKEINSEGVEQYVKTPTFKEVVAKNAFYLNWKEVIGKGSSFDLVSRTFPKNDGDNNNEAARTLAKIEPAAGPWVAVAKSLHASLQEVNVLMDTMHLLGKADYVVPVTVSAVIDEQRTSDQIASSKGFQFYTRKKTLSEAALVIQQREKSQYGEGSEKNSFFNELRKMRENWRIRKMNKSIFGDLGYRIYGPKYRPSEIFDLHRRSLKDDQSMELRACGGVALDQLCPVQVQVPQYLARRATLCVSIYHDSESGDLNLYEDQEIPFDEHSSKNVHWEKALKWAQNSLICRDIFAQLTRDCVGCKLFCSTSQHCIVLNLFDDIMLKIEHKFYPFQDIDIPDEGEPFLNRSLRELFVADQTKKPLRNQQFISLPQTHLPENFDLRGPQALSAEEIVSRTVKSSSLLSRLIRVSNHYVLVNTVIQAIKQHAIQYLDPQIQFKFIRSTNALSMISIALVNRGYEQLGKLSIHIRIFAEKVVVITKEGQHIHCRREMNVLREALLLLTSNYLLGSVAILATPYAWQILHSNNNAFNDEGIPAPTLYMCNQFASKQVFIQSPTDGTLPLIYVKVNEDPSQPLSAEAGPLSEGFRKLNYARLPGSSLVAKMDYLLLALRK